MLHGMTCSSCQAHVEKAVKKLDGVKNVNVNLISNNMVVEYDNKKISEKEIIDAVINAGYGACKFNKKDLKNDDRIKNTKVIKSMKRRLIISIIFWIPLMYVAMHHMFYEWFGVPVPNIIKTYLHGSKNALKFALT